MLHLLPTCRGLCNTRSADRVPCSSYATHLNTALAPYRPSNARYILQPPQFSRNCHFRSTQITATAVSTQEFAAPALKDKPTPPFDWHQQWYPVSTEEDLKRTTPNTFTLLGIPLVFWLDGSGTWRCFKDQCPHRLVPLSEGRINEQNYLECPYHGWAFSGSGKCEVIPQGGDPSNPRTCAIAYPCTLKQGLLWVKPTPTSQLLDAADGSPEEIPTIPEIELWDKLQGGGWDAAVASNTFRDFPYDYASLLENLLDVGHVPFTHHATVSSRSTSSVIDLEVTERGPWGFAGLWRQGPRQGQLGPQTTLFRAPCHMRHTIDALDTRGFANITAVYAVPTTPGRSRVFVRQPFKFKSWVPSFVFKLTPAWMTHLSNNTVLEDDVVFLHNQEPFAVQHGLGEKPIGQVYNMPGASDNYVTLFRTWLQKIAGGGPFGPPGSQLAAAGPRLPRDELLDRYHSHTENCMACSGALRNTRRLRSICLALVGLMLFSTAVSAGAAIAAAHPQLTSQVTATGVAWVLATSAAAGPAGWMAAAALAFFAAHHFLGGLERKFVIGDYPPPRNYKK